MPNELPEELETERLFLRCPKPGDGRLLNDAVLESIEELRPWMDWATPTPSLVDSEVTCRRAYARYLCNDELMLLVFLRDQSRLVGASGFHSINWKLRHFEIGYWGRTQDNGSGYITEAVRALAEHALTQLEATRVYIRVDDLNRPSWRVAERAGFQLEGILRNQQRNLAGQLRNTRVYSRIPDQQPLDHPWKSLGSHQLGHCHHPSYSKTILHHSKTGRPEGFAQGHPDLAPFGKCVEGAVGLGFRVHRNGQ